MDEDIVKKPAARKRVVPPKEEAPPPPVCTPRSLTPWAVLVAAVIVLAFVVFGVVSVPGQSAPRWQAVFLTNGQVYFGHITRQTTTTVVLRDVYYLQMSPSLQQRSADQPSPPPDVTLVKLGKELHGPTDAMEINREHVMFTETLRDDATVVQAIAAAMRGEVPQAEAPATPTGDAQESATGE